MALSKEKKVIVERHNKVVYDNGDTVVLVQSKRAFTFQR